MRINALASSFPVQSTGVNKTNNITQKNIARSNGTNFVHLSFKGNPDKKPYQIYAYATESNYLGGIYKAGGLGDVAEALPESIGLHGEEVAGRFIDMRTDYPYYTLNDDNGRLYVLKGESADKAKKGEALSLKDDFKLVEQNYKLQNGEQFALITEAKNGNKVDRYFLLKEVGLEGNVRRMSDRALDMETVPYRKFEVDTHGERKDRIYVIHTDEHAKGNYAYGVYKKHAPNPATATTAYGGATSAYGGSTSAYGGATTKPSKIKSIMYYNQPKTDDMFFTEQTRAALDSLKKMDTEAHGNFNPQNFMIHDRFGYPLLSDMTQAAKNGDKYCEGIRFVEILHNPGPMYQGRYNNPLDFFRIIATENDLKKLQASPNYDKIKRISDRINEGNATAEECTKLYKFFKPYFTKWMDSEGLFNMTMLAVRMTDENPQNSNIGNVSKFFGKETRNFETEDIAKSLTQALIDIEGKTIDVVNGTKPSNMYTNEKGKFFGTGTLNEMFKTKYVPFSSTDTPEKILAAKAENKKNLINMVAEATKNLSSDKDAVAKVFFNDNMISGIRKQANEATLDLTLGGLSEFKEGDLLFTTWGRPDPQKGLPITLEAFEKLLKDESIPLETRKHCKLIMGAGGGKDAFSGKHSEWVAIKEAMERIANIEIGGEKGIFKGNACYVNGTFPNRIANCVDLAIFTSRFEPCGITPFESYATGTPVLSTRTGGAPDFVRPGKTGFLTDDPFMLSAKKLGLADDVKSDVLDNARKEHTSKQIADQIKAYLEPIQDGSFETKQKEYIKNCLSEKIEWHTNREYNGGKSALEIYLKDKFNTANNDIPNEYKSDFRGEFDETAFKRRNKNIAGKLENFFKSKSGKCTVILAILGIGFAGYKAGWFSPTFEEEKKAGHLSCVG